MNADEISLIEKVIADDEEAFQEMFRIYYGKAYAIAVRIMHNDADAQDAAQETMVEVHRSIHKLKEPSYFYAWMIKIVISKCNRMYRKKSAVAVDPSQIQALDDYEEKRTYMLPEHATANALEHDVLIGLIYTLKKDLAVVLDMMYIQQMKLQEIADTLQLPLNTVKTRAVRGRKLLKQEIKNYEKLEGRKLSFRMHTPLFLTLSLFYSYCKETAKHSVQSIGNYAKGSFVQFACVVSLTALTASGIVFQLQDNAQTPNIEQPPITNTDQTVNQTENKANPFYGSNDFPTIPYQNTTIKTSLDAYYTCINWAKDYEEMKQKSQAEIEAIRPLYEALKEKQDQYWLQLVKQNWHTDFEAVLNQKND